MSGESALGAPSFAFRGEAGTFATGEELGCEADVGEAAAVEAALVEVALVEVALIDDAFVVVPRTGTGDEDVVVFALVVFALVVFALVLGA